MSATEWNIEGIAEKVMEEMKADNASIDEADDYVRRIAYWTVFSRMPTAAAMVSAQVKTMVLEKYESADLSDDQ